MKAAQRPYEDIFPGPVCLQVRDTRGVTNSTSMAVPFASLPLIVHTPVGTAAVRQPIIITATIEAAEEVAEVLLHYRLEEALEYTTIPMTEDGVGLHSAQIPTPNPGTAVYYFISAVDLAGGAVRDPSSGEHRILVDLAESALRAPSLLGISVAGIAVTVVLYALVEAWRRPKRRGP